MKGCDKIHLERAQKSRLPKAGVITKIKVFFCQFNAAMSFKRDYFVLKNKHNAGEQQKEKEVKYIPCFAPFPKSISRWVF